MAELLCFVLDPDRAADEAPTLIEFARLAYQRALRQDVPAAQWHAGMRASLTGFGVARLPLYFLAHRFRPLAFLPRVARCWMSLASRLGTGP